MASVFRMAPAPAKALWSVATTHGYSRLLSLEAPGAFLRALDTTLRAASTWTTCAPAAAAASELPPV